MTDKAFSDKIEVIQYNAALAITGAIRGSSREKLYKKLGLEYLNSRRWFKRLCLFHKIYHNKSPGHLTVLYLSIITFLICAIST